MSKTGDKIFKYALDKGRSVKNTLWIAGCFLLVAANIAFFLLFPRIVSGLAIVLSNAVTLILTFLAFKPLNSWLQDSLMERQQALIEKMEKDRELERKVEVLELENRTLADKLDTRVQTGALPVRLDYTFKVEQMEYAKQGYVVKEEEVDALERPGPRTVQHPRPEVLRDHPRGLPPQGSLHPQDPVHPQVLLQGLPGHRLQQDHVRPGGREGPFLRRPVPKTA